jgi:hypothetical protein
MVAVAVGIGVISVDRESTRHGTTTLPAAVSHSAQKKAEASSAGTPEVQNGPAFQDQATTTGRDQKLEEAKKTPSAEARKKQMPMVARGKLEDLNSRSALNAVRRETPGVVGSLARQPENALVTAPPVPSSQNGAMAQIIPAAAAPPPAAYEYAPAPNIQTADASDRATAKTKNALQSTSQTVAVTAQAPAAQAEGFVPSDNKSSGGFALGGAMRRSTVSMTELVSWTVTTAGKLQRRLRDGAVKLVEPAPGFLVRAVAAHGIEVWAGGSQHDLSARQWQQSPALFHSSDAGETWTKVKGPWHGPINQLALVDSETLTVVTADGTWTSRDAGSSWTTQ